MPILRSFLPWVVLFLFNAFDHAWMGAFVAVLSYVAVYGKKVKHLKVLDRSSVLFFFVVGLIMLFWHPIWFVQHLDYFGNGYLALVIFYTILTKKPFTIEFAKEKTPKEKWGTAGFFRENLVLSGTWFLYFALSLPLIYLGNTFSPWFRVVQGGLAIVAVVITEYFPRWYTKRI